MMRAVGRFLAIVVLVVAGLATVLFILVAIDNDGDTDLIWGGLFFATLAVAVGLVAWFLQRRLRARRDAAAPEASEKLERAERGETVELRPSALKWSLILLGSIVFSAILVPAALINPHPVTIAGAGLFGMGVVVCAIALVPGGMYLRISPEGLVVKLPLRTRRHAWSDIETFRVFEVSHRYSSTRFVGFDLRHLTPERQSAWQTIGRGMSGVDEGLPDTYGEDPERLAEVLNRLRDRYASVHFASPSELADRELARQAARVDTSRRVIVTPLVAAACVALGVLTLTGDREQRLAEWGATRDAEWWTLLAANLLHVDLMHLLLNLVLWSLAGYLLEREIGAPRMAALAVFGGIASMGLAVLLTPFALTVGVSGLVYAALAWGLVRDLHRTRTLGTVAWVMLPLGVIYTFLSPGTSIGGHLGGLAAGLLLGWSLDRARGG